MTATTKNGTDNANTASKVERDENRLRSLLTGKGLHRATPDEICRAVATTRGLEHADLWSQDLLFCPSWLRSETTEDQKRELIANGTPESKVPAYMPNMAEYAPWRDSEIAHIRHSAKRIIGKNGKYAPRYGALATVDRIVTAILMGEYDAARSMATYWYSRKGEKESLPGKNAVWTEDAATKIRTAADREKALLESGELAQLIESWAILDKIDSKLAKGSALKDADRAKQATHTEHVKRIIESLDASRNAPKGADSPVA